MGNDRAVRARGVTRYFGDVVALGGVDLDIAAGQVHGLVGPNGAGKTTLFGLLLGLAVPDGGSLEILGRTTGGAPSVPAGVAGFVDGPGLYPALTARQNLAALADLQQRASRRANGAEVERVLAEVGLTDVADDRVRGFSLGMRQRLGLAAALLARPRLLVLDEPANGLDPAGRRHLHDILRRLAAEGCAVLVSSHRMDDLAAVCTEITLLARGRTVFTGPIEKLAAETPDLDYRVVTALDVQHTVRGVARLDALVGRLVAAGESVREIAPSVPPLEAAFLALTEPEADR